MNKLLIQSVKIFRLIFFLGARVARHNPKKMIAAVKLSAPRAWSGCILVPKMPGNKPDCQTATFADVSPRIKKSIPGIFQIPPVPLTRFFGTRAFRSGGSIVARHWRKRRAASANFQKRE
jgi:hypothetical protein